LRGDESETGKILLPGSIAFGSQAAQNLRVRGRMTRLSLILLLVLGVSGVRVYAEHDKGPGGRNQNGNGKKEEVEEEGCHANGGNLASFATGESYSFPDLVHFVTHPDCNEKARVISRGLLKQVRFQDKGPFKLDAYAKQLLTDDPSVADRVEKSLQSRIPDLLAQFPLTSTEMLPVVGQLALLSQPASRIALATLIAQDLFKSGKDMDMTKPGWESSAKVLAGRLSTLGANEEGIMSELASYVGQLALLVQVDSLGNLFRGLAAASGVDKSFVPAFNLAAGAFSHGVQGAENVHTSAEKAKMLGAVFVAIQAAVESKATLEVGAAELNEAMDTLLAGRPLHQTALRKLWKETVRILGVAQGQSALADAFAVSLTPEFLYLEKKELQGLYAAAGNYPEISFALQHQMMDGWVKNWDQVTRGQMKVAQFNEMKAKIFDPVVDTMVQLDRSFLTLEWLRDIVQRGLVKDELVEKRFPKLALNLLENREKEIRGLASVNSSGDRMAHLGRDLAENWQLFRIYLPALFRWVEKHESESGE
jgi:hypothetical protein